MFKINEQVNGALYVNGKEIPMTAGSHMQEVHISAVSNLKLPPMVIVVVDMLNSLAQVGLQDGSQVTFSLRGIINSDRHFRVYTWSRQPMGEGFVYRISCYWDSPKYWGGTTSKGIQGSSSEALSAIAQLCGLKVWAKNTKTADTMLWLPVNQSYGAFARDIAKHGYVNDTSHMVYGVDSNGFMRYLDINSNPAPTNVVGFLPTEGQANSFQCIDFAPSTQSGTNNMTAGYSHVRQVQSAVTDASTENQLKYKPDSQLPLLNSEVRSVMSRSGISYSPIDFGNVHPKYERAVYQNTRFDLLNSLGGDFLFGYPVPFEMFDNFKHVTPQEYGNTVYDGEYTVKGKIISITGTSYYEKILTVKNGLEK